MLPTIKLGQCDVTRLIVGGNPFSGNSHVSVEMSGEMADYFSCENIKKTLLRCMECGINTMQLRGDKHIMRMIREFRLDGGKLHWIAQTASELGSYEGMVHSILQYQPIAIYHHGTLTDSLYKEGKMDEVNEHLKFLRSTGTLVGLATHIPEVVEYCEEHNFDLDFYMTSVYNISKIERVSSEITGKQNAGEPFDEQDIPIMYKTVRMVNKPCLVFKILGASRRCGTPEEVRAAFQEAFDNIKPTDGVIVGMFPRDRDQVKENTGYVREILGAK